jgi:hypothetical protein
MILDMYSQQWNEEEIILREYDTIPHFQSQTENQKKIK